ncbi:hypothetical protein PTKIN_Ptkin04bG0081200 [Pterospermum kingtungense]
MMNMGRKCLVDKKEKIMEMNLMLLILLPKTSSRTNPIPTLLHGLKVTGINMLCGVGILSTSYAAKEGGWLGLIILFTFALLSFYTRLLLRRCLDTQSGLETYPDIGQVAFGTTGRIAISVSL